MKQFFILIFLLLSFDSIAATCGKLYAQGYHTSAQEDYELYIFPDELTIENCNDYVISPASEFVLYKKAYDDEQSNQGSNDWQHIFLGMGLLVAFFKGFATGVTV